MEPPEVFPLLEGVDSASGHGVLLWLCRRTQLKEDERAESRSEESTVGIPNVPPKEEILLAAT
jgi:hypothetical protein